MLLKKLTDANGVPSLEDEVRNLIKEEIRDYVDDIKVDRMGNIIAIKNKTSTGKNIIVTAHMDEAGLIITNVDSKGLIKFDFWGVDERNLVSQQVEIGDKKIKGIIGAKPIHLQKPKERNTIIPKEGLYIDIGSDSKEETLKHVSLGDGIAFKNVYEELGENIVKAKAINNRVSCYALIEILKSDLPYKITACFTVQNEVTARGAKVLAKNLKGDMVLNLDTTTSADRLFDNEKHFGTSIGKGVAISLIDTMTIYSKKYNDEIVEVAKLNNIEYQLNENCNDLSDAGLYNIENGGTPVITLSIPCRYCNTSVSMFNKKDLESMICLIDSYIKKVNMED